MALSDWDKKHLDKNQQRAVQTYTVEWEKARREGNEERMRWAHNGAEAIRRQAGYSGGNEGVSFLPASQTATATTGTTANSRTAQSNSGKGYDNGSLTPDQVKTLQKALGVAQDGFFGPQTQQAAFARWGVSSADAAMQSYSSTTTPARTSFNFDEDEGVYTWNGQRFTSENALVSAINSANLSASEKEIVGRKAAVYGIKLNSGNFRGTEKPASNAAQSGTQATQAGNDFTAKYLAAKSTGQATAPAASVPAFTTALPTVTAASAAKQTQQNQSVWDRIKSTLFGTGKQYGGSLSNAAGVAADAVDGTAMSSVYKDQVEMLDRQIAALENLLRDPTMTAQDIKEANEALAQAREQRAIYANAVRSGENTAREVYKISDDLARSGAQDIERAKEGASTLGKIGIDVFSQGAQMGADALLGIGTGVGTLGMMGARTFGAGAQEARQNGANLQQSVLYGMGNAAVEVLTEKMFDGLAGLYGKGAADDIVKGAINRLAQNEAARRALNVAASAAGESVEELVSGLVNPALKAIYDGKGVGQNYSELEARDVLYDMLIGGILGGVGGGVEVVRDARSNQGNATPAPVNAGARQTSAEGNLTPATNGANLGAKNGSQNAQAQTPVNAVPAAQQAANITPQGVETAQGITPIQAAVSATIENGRAPNSIIDRVIADVDSMAQLGIDTNGLTASQTREAVRSAVSNIAARVIAPARAAGRDVLSQATLDAALAPTPEAQAGARAARDAELARQRTDTQRRLDEIFANSPVAERQTAPAASPTENVNPVVSAAVRAMQGNDTQGIDADAAARLLVDSANAAAQKKVSAARDFLNMAQQRTDDSLGSARSGFDPYSAAENRYGTQDGGEKAVRPDDAPVSTNGKDRVSRSVMSAKGAAVTPDDFVPLLEKSTMKGDYSFIPITNDATTQSAMEYIDDHGWDDALRLWRRNAARGKYSPTMNVVGQLLYNNAVNSDDTALALDIFSDYQATLRNSAQILQSARILKNMTPANRLYMIQKSIAQYAEEAGIPEGIKLSAAVKQQYMNAKTEAQRDAAILSMQKEVAAQLPSTLLDKWNALRYVNMLGNFKTQIRNIQGNISMQAMTRIKDTIAAGLENLVYVASGGDFERTKAVFPGIDRINAARADFSEVEKIALGESKYSSSEGSTASDFMRGAQDMKRIFQSRTLEAYRKATNWAMEKGDVIFSKSNYAHALAGYLKAHNVSAEQFTSEAWRANNANFLDTARAYAIQEAQEATFRDTNKVSEWLSHAARRENTPWYIRLLGEGVAPFRKTPANIAVRMEEYSPLGIVNTAVKAAQAADPSSDVSGADVINQLAKTLTGSGLMALGAWLRSKGLIRGGDDEDKDQQLFDKLTGHQNYAVELPGGFSFTLDWNVPASVPFFMGVALYDAMDDGGLEISDLGNIAAQVTEPMMQMSILQSVDNVLDDLKYSDRNLAQLAGTLAVSYLTQGLTNTLVGQLERTGETERMMTYVEHDNPLPAWLQRAIGKASAKIPGWDYQQIPYIDAWGKMQSTGELGQRALVNLFSPGYVSHVETSAVEDELQRLVDKTGKSTLYPDNAEKSFQVSGATKYLTGDEYVRYAMKKGQESARILDGMMRSGDYAALPDDKKASAIEKAYEYATAEAKENVSDYKIGDSSWINNARKSGMPIDEYILAHAKYGGSKYLVGDAADRLKQAEQIGMSSEDYIKMRGSLDANGNGSISQAEAQDYLDNYTSLSQEQKAAMWNIINKGWKTNPYK